MRTLQLSCSILIFFAVLCSSHLECFAAADPDTSITDTSDSASIASVSGTTSTPELLIIRAIEPVPEPPEVQWKSLVRQANFLLGIEHAFRIATEPGTRDATGDMFKGYFRAVGNMHGWADGDEFYVNYIGHPMAGAVAGHIWLQNDLKYRDAEFGRDSRYWKGLLRAATFAFAYSEQFEIGPLSEASIGQIQSLPPATGFVDHVITPVIGMGWMIAEDSLDKYVVEPLEGRTGNRLIRLALRGGLNPARSMANTMRWKYPWYRDTRAGISTYDPETARQFAEATRVPVPIEGPVQEIAPFEFSVSPNVRTFLGANAGSPCVGGGASAAWRLSPYWQLVLDVGGCKLLGLEQNLSGDSLSYLLGPRWTPSPSGRWSPYVQVLIGGNKLTQERMDPEKKRLLEMIAGEKGTPPPLHEAYTQQDDTNGFALSAGTGLDLKVNRALALRLASLEYNRSWANKLNGVDYSSGMQATMGVILRVGTW